MVDQGVTESYILLVEDQDTGVQRRDAGHVAVHETGEVVIIIAKDHTAGTVDLAVAAKKESVFLLFVMKERKSP